MNRCIGVLSLTAVLMTACSQYRTVPVSEASKFSSDKFPDEGGVVVHDTDGNRVRIEHFKYVAIEGEKCIYLADKNHKAKPCLQNGNRFAAPLGIKTEGTTVFVQPNARHRDSQTIKLERVREVTLIERNPNRGAIVIPIAIVVGVLGFFGGGALGDAIDDSEDNATPALLAIGGAVAGTGVSLLIGLPLTAKLGETLNSDSTPAGDTNR